MSRICYGIGNTCLILHLLYTGIWICNYVQAFIKRLYIHFDLTCLSCRYNNEHNCILNDLSQGRKQSVPISR